MNTCPSSCGRWISIFTLVALFLAPTGCSDDDPITPPVPGNENMGPAGGTLVSSDGRASLAVPAGALNDSLEITIAPATSIPAGALTGTAYECGPDGTTFNLFSTLTIGYDPAQMPSGTFHRDLKIGTVVTNSWVPLADSTVDSLAHMVTGSLSHLSIYGIIVPGTGAIDSLTVTLTDDPDPINPQEFENLVDALDHLAANLAYEDLGVVSWQTSTPQQVESLAFAYDLRIDVESGYTGIIVGPGTGPLTIDAGGAVQLSGFTILSPVGLVLNGNRMVDIAGSNLPDFSTVSVGGVKGAPFPAADPGYAGKRQAAERASGVRLDTNIVGDSLELKLDGGLAVGGTYDLLNNTAPRMNLGGTAPLGGYGRLQLDGNISDYVTVDMDMVLNAEMAVGNHNANEFTVTSTVDGQNKIDLQGDVFAIAKFKFDGLGELTLSATSENLGEGDFEIGLPIFNFEGLDPVASRLIFIGAALAATQVDYAINLAGASISELLSYDFTLGDSGNLNVGLENLTDVEGITLRSSLQTVGEWENFTVRGAVEIVAEANLMNITQSNVDVQGAVEITSGPLSAGLNLFANDARFDGTVQAVGFGLFLKFTETIHYDTITVDASSDKSRQVVVARQEDPRILLEEVDWFGEGSEGVEIVGASIPVIVRNCYFDLAGPLGPTLRILECEGEITVEDCEFQGNGVTVLDSPGTVNITGNEINLTGGPSAGINLGSSGSATVSGNTVTAGQGILAAITISGMVGTTTFTDNTVSASNALQAISIGPNRVMLDNNTIAGAIGIVTGPVHMSGNDLASASVGDVLGGLMNDPVPDNDGLLPNNVFTRCDFDGNGCCEYPPPNNQPDQHGQCPCEGVDPPSK